MKTDPVLAVASTTALFSDPSFAIGGDNAVTYDVAADGRFVLPDLVGRENNRQSITVVQNWYEEFRDREQD